MTDVTAYETQPENLPVANKDKIWHINKWMQCKYAIFETWNIEKLKKVYFTYSDKRKSG